jgi:hypothetical protein
MSEYFKQKLLEAMNALVCDGEIDKRLSAATIYLRHLHDADVPPEYLEQLRNLKVKLTKTPFSSEFGYLPSQLSTSEANALAREILNFFAVAKGEP